MSSKPEKPDAAPASDPMVEMQGRLSAIQKQVHSEFKAMRDALDANTAALDAMTAKFGELVAAAPRAGQVDPVPLSKEQIEAIVRARPQASFRLLQDVTSPSFNRSRGAIIRPQTMDQVIWRGLLSAHVKMADADENP